MAGSTTYVQTNYEMSVSTGRSLLEPYYYLNFFLWRVCRASKDKAFGEFRVRVLLLLAEANFGFSLMYAVFDEGVSQINFYLAAVGLVLVPGIINFFLLSDQRKRPFEKRFRQYSSQKRWIADIVTAIAYLGALFCPLLVRVFVIER